MSEASIGGKPFDIDSRETIDTTRQIGGGGLKMPSSSSFVEGDGKSDWAKFEFMIKERIKARKGRLVRSQNKIIIAILEACRTPSVEHWIMIKARLGYQTFWFHTSHLLSEGMMEVSFESEGSGNKGRRARTLYSITESGLRLLERLKSMEMHESII